MLVHLQQWCVVDLLPFVVIEQPAEPVVGLLVGFGQLVESIFILLGTTKRRSLSMLIGRHAQ